jgi:hypothetical protein
MDLLNRSRRKARFLGGYLKSHLLGSIYRERYRSLRSFLIFVGYPRSGHTLVAALLDAHPNIVISIEWGALSHLRMGYRRYGMLYAIEKHSRLFTEKLANRWTGYSYRVEGQWQGKYDEIFIMGDKLAGQTSKMLMVQPELLHELKSILGIELKIIHVIRNPFDTISAMAYRSVEKKAGSVSAADLSEFSRSYFERVELVISLKKYGEYEIFDLYHEDLILDPRQNLVELLEFIGIGYDESYLQSCSEIVYGSPHRRRAEFSWPDALKEEVQKQMDNYDFLSRYDFDH